MAFKPFHRFVYNDSVFIRNNIGRLIPGGRELTKFHEGEFEEIDPNIVRTAILLSTDGLPPFVDQIAEETYDNAINHLNFFMSDCVSDVLFDGMNYDQEDFEKWRILLITVMLSKWFSDKTPLRLLVYTPRCLAPLGILKSPAIAEQFETQLRPMTDKFLGQENLSIVKASRLIAKNRLFGYSSEFFKVFNPHDHVLYGPAMNAISKYTSQNTKEGERLAATLMTVYFPESSIDAALKS